jgi:NADPH:quinone reductase
VRAIRFHAHGGPEVLRLDELDAPIPGPGEIAIDVVHAGVNFIDVYQRTGLYPTSSLPAIAGREGAGRIAALGADVAGLRVGERVAFLDAAGGYAERVLLPAARALPVPETLAPELAAALPLQGVTAHYLVRTIAAAGPGTTLLIHAAAGGVGRLATRLAKLAGATVFGTCSTPAKAESARAAGCDHPILYTATDFADEVLRVTGGRGVDVVLDSVGRATFAGSVRATRVRGTLVCFGQSSGMLETFSPRPVLGSRTLVTATIADYARDRDELLARWNEVVEHARAGELVPRIDRIHPLAEAAAAHRRLEARETSGKLLLAVGG